MDESTTEKYILKGVALSTRPIRGRSERIPAELIRSLVDRLPAGSPFGHNHGLEVRAGRLTRAWVEEAKDGATELWLEAEADVPLGIDVLDYLGTAFSPSLIAYYDDHTGAEQVLIAADSLSFTKGAQAKTRVELEGAGLSAYVTDYFQYSELPPPWVVVHLARAVVHILDGTAGAALWAAIERAVRRLAARNTRKESGCYLSLELEGVPGLKVYVPNDRRLAKVVIRECFKGMRLLIDQRGSSEAPGWEGPTPQDARPEKVAPDGEPVEPTA